MGQIEKQHLERLRNLGLVVSEPFAERHVLSRGVHIGKPATVKGNSIPDYNEWLGEVKLDAPAVVLFEKSGEWHVWAQDHAPTPGPGDFETRWATVEEAIADAIDFYFGNPERMAAKAAAKEAVRARSAAYDEKNKTE